MSAKTRMLTVALLSIHAIVLRADTLYVDETAPSGNGASWATAFTDLQDALATAVAGDDIWVARGTYVPSDCDGGLCLPQHRGVPFMIDSGITLLGGFAGDETSATQRDPAFNHTILSGDLAGNDLPNFINYDDNSFQVVYIVSSLTPSVVDGFTIRGGNAEGFDSLGWGGGIQVETFATATVSHCTLRDNTGLLGGGMFTNFASHTTIEACLFTHNTADNGGGLYNNRSIAPLINNRFIGNEALSGGAVYTTAALTMVTNCTFTENFALDSGGALFINTPDNVAINNSILYGDTPDELSGDLTDLAVHHCNVEGGFLAIGNIDADPLFFDPAAGDYRLQPGSPCIDAGQNDVDTDNSTPVIDPLPSTDFNERQRFVDDRLTDDCPQPLAICGIPPVVDMGASEMQGMACEDVSDCADQDGNGIRDDNCLWWECKFGSCDQIDIVFADMGGQFGACPVDGTADNNDRNHALNCFADVDIDGNAGEYPCEAHPLYPPTALNVDAGGPFGACPPDGVCDGNDAFHALNAFAGDSTCSCPLNDVPAPDMTPPPAADQALLRLEPARAIVSPGGLVDIAVYLDTPLADLRGYQLHVATAGGHHRGLELVDISLAPPPNAIHAFDSTVHWDAYNVATGQMVAGLDTPGVPTPGGAYLATFTFRATPDAAGSSAIVLLSDATDPAHRSFLFASDPRQRIDIIAAPVTITVRNR